VQEVCGWRTVVTVAGALTVLLVCACDRVEHEAAEADAATASRAASAPPPVYLASIPPLGLIIAELAEGRAEVQTLLPAGASPHAYEPKPSDALAAREAKALFYVSDELDLWAARLETEQRIAVFEFVPEDRRLPLLAEHLHEFPVHGGQSASADGAGPERDVPEAADPHFWTDPLVVAAMLPSLVSTLSSLDPEGATLYGTNARRFSAELVQLDADARAQLEPYVGGGLLMLHASMQYFCRRYGLEVVGVIQPFPGKEPSPADLVELAGAARREGALAVFGEPQLPREAAQAIAETLGLPLGTFDPLGGDAGCASYRELILRNARAVVEVFGE
jgi:zinc transport system substrate-binding protein